jgi:hypothetical protein
MTRCNRAAKNACRASIENTVDDEDDEQRLTEGRGKKGEGKGNEGVKWR